MSNAREFLDAMADTLRAHGHEVSIKASEECFGTFVWMKSHGDRWETPMLNLSAMHCDMTGRWRLGELRVWIWDGKTWCLRRYGTRPQIARAVANFADVPCNGVQK